ncbi:MAG: hypothetical protein AAGH15_17865, partial [Myxococcota bacterium]
DAVAELDDAPRALRWLRESFEGRARREGTMPPPMAAGLFEEAAALAERAGEPADALALRVDAAAEVTDATRLDALEATARRTEQLDALDAALATLLDDALDASSAKALLRRRALLLDEGLGRPAEAWEVWARLQRMTLDAADAEAMNGARRRAGLPPLDVASVPPEDPEMPTEEVPLEADSLVATALPAVEAAPGDTLAEDAPTDEGEVEPGADEGEVAEDALGEGEVGPGGAGDALELGADDVELLEEDDAEPVELIEDDGSVELIEDAEPVELLEDDEPVERIEDAEPVELLEDDEPVELLEDDETVELLEDDETGPADLLDEEIDALLGDGPATGDLELVLDDLDASDEEPGGTSSRPPPAPES